MSDFNFLNTDDNNYLNTSDSLYVGLGGSAIFGPLINGTTYTADQGIRVRINSADTFGGNTGLVVFSFTADTSSDATIENAFVGLGVDDTSFVFVAGSQMQLLFNGATFATIAAGTTLDSDPIFFSFLDNDRLLVSYNQSGDIMRFSIYPGAPNTVSSLTQSWLNASAQPDPSSQYPPAGGTADAYNIVGLKEIRSFSFSGYGQLFCDTIVSGAGGYYPKLIGDGALTVPVTLAGIGDIRPPVSGSGALKSGTYISNSGWVEIMGAGSLSATPMIKSTSSNLQFFMNF